MSLTVEALETELRNLWMLDPDDAAKALLPFIERHIAGGQQGKAGGVAVAWVAPYVLDAYIEDGSTGTLVAGPRTGDRTVPIYATPPAHSPDAGVKDGGWRDIYSIPKDQTRVELLAANGKRDVGNYYHIDNPSYGFMEHLITDGGHGNYTHWRPLAPQPKDAT